MKINELILITSNDLIISEKLIGIAFTNDSIVIGDSGLKKYKMKKSLC